MIQDLFDAIAAGDLDRLAELLAAGANVKALQPEHPHFTTLDAAIDVLEDGGPIDALVLLLRAGAPVDAKDGLEASTPVLTAVFREQPMAVRLLLAAGADPNIVGSEGDSPLRFCAERGWREMAELLLRCGARATIDEPGGPTGMNALGFAARRLDVDMVRLLLAHGARPGAPDADGLVPLDRLRWLPEPADPESKAKLAEIQALLGSRPA